MPAPMKRVLKSSPSSACSGPGTGDKLTGPVHRRVRRTLLKLASAAKKVLGPGAGEVQMEVTNEANLQRLRTPPRAEAGTSEVVSPLADDSVKFWQDPVPLRPALRSPRPRFKSTMPDRPTAAARDRKAPELDWVKRKNALVALDSPEAGHMAHQPEPLSQPQDDEEVGEEMTVWSFFPQETIADAKWHFEVVYPALCQSQKQYYRKRLYKSGEAEARDSVVQWMTIQHMEFQCSPHVLYLAVQLMGRILAKHTFRSTWRGPSALKAVVGQPTHLLGAGALMIAAKFEDLLPPDHLGLASASAGHFNFEEVHAMEVFVVQEVGYKLHYATASHHLEMLLSLCTGGVTSPEHVKLVQYLATRGLCSEDAPQWTAEHHAAGAVLLSRMMMIQNPPWPLAFESVVVKQEADRRAVRLVAVMIYRVLQSVGPGHAVYDKFAMEAFGGVSLWAVELRNSELIAGLLSSAQGQALGERGSSEATCVCF